MFILPVTSKFPDKTDRGTLYNSGVFPDGRAVAAAIGADAILSLPRKSKAPPAEKPAEKKDATTPAETKK